MNSRFLETKKLLQDGLVKVMLVKPYERISVSDITRAANLNRTTFYCHYKNVNDLYKEICDVLMKKSFDVFTSREKGIENFLSYVKDNKETYRALLLNPSNNDFMYQFSKKMLDEAMRYYGKNIDYKKMYYSYSLYGSIGMVKQWIESDFKLNKKVLADIINELADDVEKIAKKNK